MVDSPSASKWREAHTAHDEDSLISSISATPEPNSTSHDESYMTTSTTSTLRHMNSVDSHDDSHMTSRDSHMTNPKSSSPLNNLADHILSCSTQPNPHHQISSSSSQSNSTSLVVSSWLPHRDDLPRPTSPTAVNRVFKVVFLGKI